MLYDCERLFLSTFQEKISTGLIPLGINSSCAFSAQGKHSKRNGKQSTEVSISNYFIESSHKPRLPSVESFEACYVFNTFLTKLKKELLGIFPCLF